MTKQNRPPTEEEIEKLKEMYHEIFSEAEKKYPPDDPTNQLYLATVSAAAAEMYFVKLLGTKKAAMSFYRMADKLAGRS